MKDGKRLSDPLRRTGSEGLVYLLSPMLLNMVEGIGEAETSALEDAGRTNS